MNTLKAVSAELLQAKETRGLTDAALARQTGIQRLTVARAMSGRENFGLSTLLVLADRLGLELMLVPKDAARALRGPGAGEVQSPVRSLVDDLRSL